MTNKSVDALKNKYMCELILSIGQMAALWYNKGERT